VLKNAKYLTFCDRPQLAWCRSLPRRSAVSKALPPDRLVATQYVISSGTTSIIDTRGSVAFVDAVFEIAKVG